MKIALEVPVCMQGTIEEFYDELCKVLTEWEQGEISDFELYSFMVDVQNAISNISYAEEEK